LIEQNLSEKIARSSNEELIPIIILISEQINDQSLAADATSVPKIARRELVVSQLKTLSQCSQKDIITFLKTKQKQGKVKNISSLWIINAIGAEVTKDVIEELSKTPGICQISCNGEYFHILEQAGTKVGELQRAIAWHVQKIQADLVWGLGYTGKGIIVGVLDTGVRWSHNDLQDHMWIGGTLYPNYGWNFVSDNNSPYDDNGHGTHVAGIIAGDGTAGTQTGVAPDARIMAVKVLNSAGAGSFITIAKGVQFAIEHNADIINLSLGADSANNSTKDYCRDMCKMAYIAEVPMAIATGNGRSGSPGSHYPVPFDISTPGDVPAPWYAPNGGNNAVMAVGATDNSDVIANFSSYGPTQWNTSIYADYPYPPGLKKPDVSAPGVNITSLDYLSATGYTIKSGTSMATPCLAGTIALMLEKNRFLTCREIDSIIETTALDLGAAGRDNYYGAGRINALNAVNAVTATIAIKGTFYIKNAATATGNLEFDENLTWNKSWIKDASATSYVVGPGESTAVNVYVDTTGIPNNTTWYDTIWVYCNDPGKGLHPEPVWLVRGTIGIEEPSYHETHSRIEQGTSMLHISPNPFKQKAEIKFQIPKNSEIRNSQSEISVKIYDATGRLVKSFNLSTRYSLLATSVEWDGTDDFGRRLPAGVYFVVPEGLNLAPARVVKIR
jgi:serine protease AprX